MVASNVSGSSRHLEDVQSQVKITRADIACFTDALRLVGAHKPETIYREEVHAGERKPYKNVVNGELLPCHRFGERNISSWERCMS